MPWCPKCGSEYRSGIQRCADCDEPLVTEEPSRVSEPIPPEQRQQARYLNRLGLASEGARRAWRMRAFWLVLGALAVVQAIGPTVSLMRGWGAVYGNEGFRWQLVGFGLSMSYEWLYPPVVGDTVTAGIRAPFRDVVETAWYPVSIGVDKLLRGRGLSPATQWAVYTCAILSRALLWAALIALALQWIATGLHEGETARLGFWRTTAGSLGPMFAIGVILVEIAWIGALGRSLVHKAFPTVDETVLDVWQLSLVHVIAFPLALTPFVIVGKRVGIVAGVATTFRLIAASWRQLLLIVVLYRAGFVVVEFMGWMAYFVGRICLLPPHLMQLHVPALESVRDTLMFGVSPAAFVGWMAQIAKYWTSSGLDLLLCTTLMLLVVHTSETGTVRPSEGRVGPEN